MDNKTFQASRRAALWIVGGIATMPSVPTLSIAELVQEKPVKKPDPIRPELVKEFVGAGHGKFERTKEMLLEMPSLLNATWDWGGGDFETALGGAGHMGNREIAEFLITKGARMDIFVAAMLGKIGIVQAMIIAYPEIQQSRGPHGITLLTHAQKGGEQALPVVEYLRSLGINK